jgi:GTP-binding nuclear protein Ran
MESKSFKIIMVGSGGVGKSTYLKRVATGCFDKKYDFTMGVAIQKLSFSVVCSDGATRNVTLRMWDTAGQKEWAGLQDGYYIAADGAILMFDVTNKSTYKDLDSWYSKMPHDVPTVLCGNKVDCKDRQVKPKDISFHRKRDMMYYDISVKSNYNFEAPFVYLIRKLLNDPGAHLSADTVLIPYS